jgi:hypothetical protein
MEAHLGIWEVRYLDSLRRVTAFCTFQYPSVQHPTLILDR